jgi:CRP/FNR family transcriptional regulator, cyclic AMP receptor protein
LPLKGVREVPLAATLASVQTPALIGTFLTTLPSEALDDLLADGSIHEVRSRRLIFGASDPGRVGVILEGLARTYLSSADGRQFTLRYVRPGEILGNTSGPTAERAPLNAAAVTDCTVFEFDPVTLAGLVLRDSRVGAALVYEMNLRIADAFAAIAANSLGSMHERVAWHLLDLAAESPDEGRLIAPVTQQQLADHIGTAREVVARALRDLRESGIVATGKGEMEICDPVRLAAIAGRKLA